MPRCIIYHDHIVGYICIQLVIFFFFSFLFFSFPTGILLAISCVAQCAPLSDDDVQLIGLVNRAHLRATLANDAYVSRPYYT